MCMCGYMKMHMYMSMQMYKCIYMFMYREYHREDQKIPLPTFRLVIIAAGEDGNGDVIGITVINGVWEVTVVVVVVI